MAPKDGGAKTPETFLSVFADETAKRLKGDELEAAKVILAGFRETVGFPRGASYTDHKRTGNANVSLTVETRNDGNGFDVILSPMAGSNAADAAWRLVNILAAALYPTVTLDDGKKDHKRPERAKVVKALGVSWAKGAKAATFADWPALPWPEALYHGSDVPNPKRVMVAFVILDKDGKATKDVVYRSLLADGSDAPAVADAYEHGIKIGGVKKLSSPKAYYSKAQKEAAEKEQKAA